MVLLWHHYETPLFKLLFLKYREQFVNDFKCVFIYVSGSQMAMLGTHILHWIPSWKQRAPKLKNIFNVAWVVIYFILHTGFQGRA